MAKTIMVSNSAYEELRKIKEEGSFSEVIIDLVGKGRVKTGIELKKHLGALRGERESDKFGKVLKKGWKRWQKRYA